MSLYFRHAIRKILKNKMISIINLLGLAVGLAAFIVITFYIDFETGYDEFHQDKDKIYRVESSFLPVETESQRFATSSFGYGPAMKAEIPEVKDFCRMILSNHQRDIRYKDVVQREDYVMPVDSNFFTFFSYPLLQGDPKKVLTKPNSMVISQKAAKKYFKDENPIGKMLEVRSSNGSAEYTVTGIFKNIPAHSHIKFDFLLSYPYQSNFFQNTWYMHEAFLYVKANSVAEARIIEQKFIPLSEKYKTLPALQEKTWAIDLIPLTDIWLEPAKTFESEAKGNHKSIILLRFIAIMMLAMGWLNYFNLSNTKNIENIQESYVSRIHGAKYSDLGNLFLFESFLMNLFAVILSLLLILFSQPLIENYLNDAIFTNFWRTPFVWNTTFVTMVLGTVINGFAPSFIVTRLLKSKYSRNQNVTLLGTGYLRASMVVLQFGIAIVFIVGTIAVKKQISFMKDQDLGIDIKQTLVIKAPTASDNYDQKINVLRNELTSLSSIKSFTGSSAIPGVEVAHLLSNTRADDEQRKTNLHEALRVDEHFIPTYNLHLLHGRNFKTVGETENNSVIVNQTSAKVFGFTSDEDAVGKEIYLEGMANRKFTIIGVIGDYHHMSLKEGYKPIILFCSTNAHRWIRNAYYSAKISSSNMPKTLAEVKEIYHKHFPKASFNYSFLDEQYNHQYQSDVQFGKLFSLFTWMALFIVCLGLMGLTSFILLKRSKEIGIRKVNGAMGFQIIGLLNKQFILWLIVAFVIATPLSWYLMQRWLNNFATHTNLSWWVFGSALFIVIAVTILTVSLLSWKRAVSNPVTTLRYE